MSLNAISFGPGPQRLPADHGHRLRDDVPAARRPGRPGRRDRRPVLPAPASASRSTTGDSPTPVAPAAITTPVK